MVEKNNKALDYNDIFIYGNFVVHLPKKLPETGKQKINRPYLQFKQKSLTNLTTYQAFCSSGRT